MLIRGIFLFGVLTSMTISCQKKKSASSLATASDNFKLALLVYADRVRDDSALTPNSQLNEACLYALSIDAQHPLATDKKARLKGVRPFNPLPVDLTELQASTERDLPEVVAWLNKMRNSHKEYPLLIGTEPPPAAFDQNLEGHEFGVSLSIAQRLLEIASMHLKTGQMSCPRSIEP